LLSVIFLFAGEAGIPPSRVDDWFCGEAGGIPAVVSLLIGADGGDGFSSDILIPSFSN